MAVKDYYKILELSPGATTHEVKKRFRKLAMRYHPDTNAGHQYAEAWFREVQEAYAVLMDPAKKDAYLQERWLAKSMGKTLRKATPITPDTIVEEAKELAGYIGRLDHFRMDQWQISSSMVQLLDEERIRILKQYKAHEHQMTIGKRLLEACRPIDYLTLIPFFERMQVLAADIPMLQQLLNDTIRSKKQHQWWATHQWWIMLLATLALCILVWLVSR